MPKLSSLALHENLLEALKITARTAEPKISNRQLAEAFKDLNAELIEPFIPEIVLGYLENQIGYLRAKIRRKMNHQFVFERKLGFTHLAKTVEVKPGKIVPRGETTRRQFWKQIAQAREAHKANVAQLVEDVERGDAMFARYTKNSKTQRIKWTEVVTKEAEKAIQQGLFDAPDLE